MFEAVRRMGKGRSDLFGRIGLFLDAQGLTPDPANYALAHAALSDPDSPLALAIGRLTDGGVRLSRQELEQLGGTVGTRKPADPERDARAEALVAQTQAQVAGFADLISTIRAETHGFGRDLAESTAQIAGVDRPTRSSEEIARIAGAMVARVRNAEQRLAKATEETDALRAKLAEARDTARRDTLTGLPNRLAFDEAFNGRDEKEGPFALAICDIDHFKRLNDRHGHAVGDRVLHALAQALEEECAGHLVVRYGGEEFAILTRGLEIDAATALVDRARAQVSARRFRNRDTADGIGHVSFSAGVTIVGRREDKATAFDRADRLLYRAKADGRDQVCQG